MNKLWITLALGVCVVLIPFSGFPGAWKEIMYVVFGGTIVVISTMQIRYNSKYHCEECPIREEV